MTLFSTIEINTDTNVTRTEGKAEKIERTVFGDDLPVWDDALQQERKSIGEYQGEKHFLEFAGGMKDMKDIHLNAEIEIRKRPSTS